MGEDRRDRNPPSVPKQVISEGIASPPGGPFATFRGKFVRGQ
jgi:hypothetical protein